MLFEDVQRKYPGQDPLRFQARVALAFPALNAWGVERIALCLTTPTEHTFGLIAEVLTRSFNYAAPLERDGRVVALACRLAPSLPNVIFTVPQDRPRRSGSFELLSVEAYSAREHATPRYPLPGA